MYEGRVKKNNTICILVKWIHFPKGLSKQAYYESPCRLSSFVSCYMVSSESALLTKLMNAFLYKENILFINLTLSRFYSYGYFVQVRMQTLDILYLVVLLLYFCFIIKTIFWHSISSYIFFSSLSPNKFKQFSSKKFATKSQL